MADIEKRRRDRWNFLFIAGMWFQDLFNYDFRRTEQCIIPYATQEGEISFCAYNTGVGWRNIVEKMHMTATLTKWYEEKGRHEIIAGGKNVNLPSKEHYLVLRADDVNHGLQHDLDEVGIAKTAREEKKRARDLKLSEAEERSHGQALSPARAERRSWTGTSSVELESPQLPSPPRSPPKKSAPSATSPSYRLFHETAAAMPRSLCFARAGNIMVTNRKAAMLTGLRTCITAALLLGSPLGAQWKKIPTKNVALTAPVPRAADGHPDLSGIWEPMANKYVRDIAADLKPSDIPFQPWAKALVAERADGSHSGEDPYANCLPQGVPKVNAAPPPWKVIQQPDVIAILYESANPWRQIFLDGRELGKDYNPTWLGYSTGKWEGDTLVVDTRGFNGKAWLDQYGQADVRRSTRHRTLPAHGFRPLGYSNHDRRSQGLHQTLDGQPGSPSVAGHGVAGVYLQRE